MLRDALHRFWSSLAIRHFSVKRVQFRSFGYKFDMGRVVPAVLSGAQRHYAAEVDSNLPRETNRLLKAHSVKT